MSAPMAPSDEFQRVISGCCALYGCPVKERCVRYQQYVRSTPFHGFNAYHTCIVPLKHFMEKEPEEEEDVMSEPPVDYEHLATQHPALQHMNAAEDFPSNTCPASRIAASVAEALITGRPYPLLTEEQSLCGEMLAATVAALWELRTEVALMKKKIDEA